MTARSYLLVSLPERAHPVLMWTGDIPQFFLSLASRFLTVIPKNERTPYLPIYPYVSAVTRA